MAQQQDGNQDTFRPAWFIAQQVALPILASFVIVVLCIVWVPSPAEIPVAAAAALVALAFLWRVVATHVTIGDGGLAWSDCWGSGAVAWNEIVEISTVRPHPFPPVQIAPFTALVVQTRDQKPQVIYGSALLRHQRRDELVADLRRCAKGHGLRILVISDDLTSATQRAPRRQD